ncbi:MAG: response regulator [Candidatus Binatia bacterium]
METRRILYAEDSANDVELTLTALQEHQIADRLQVVNDGADALDYLYKRGRFEGSTDGQPSLILLDLKMPKVDGLEVLRKVKGDPALRTTPVILLTSSAENGDIRAAYELGANAYVVKPVDFDHFVSVVKEIGLFWILTNTPAP